MRLVPALLVVASVGASAGCRGLGDGRGGQLAVGFDPAARPIAVGVELQLAVERPKERGHFCVGHCELDDKLAPLVLRRVVSSHPERLQVLSFDDSDPRAPLVRVRTLAPGEVALEVEAQSGRRTLHDAWTFEVHQLARVEVSVESLGGAALRDRRLPENARVELQLRPVDADGHELYTAPLRARLYGEAHLAADDGPALLVDTGAAGQATLELRAPTQTRLVPFSVGETQHAALP